MAVSRSVRRPGYNNLEGALNSKQTVSAIRPLKPKDKDRWINTSENKEYRFDKTLNDWVLISGGSSELVISGQLEEELIFGENLALHDLVYGINSIPGLVLTQDLFPTGTDPQYSTGGANACKFNPDGSHLAVACQISPWLAIYKKVNSSFELLPTPDILPTASVSDCSYSPNGLYLAVVFNAPPYMHVYSVSGDTYTKLEDPVPTLSHSFSRCTFSPNSMYLAIAGNIIVYKITDGIFNVLPISLGYGVRSDCCNFSPDGNYFLSMSINSPYLWYYKISGDTFTQINTPSPSPPSGASYSSAFSPNGRYLVVTVVSASYYSLIYERQGDYLIPISNPLSPAISGYMYGCSFSPDSLYLVFTDDYIPNFRVYKFSKGLFTLVGPNHLYDRQGRSFGCSFSPDGIYLAIAARNAPAVTIYSSDLVVYKSNNSLDQVDMSTVSVIGYTEEAGNTGETKKVMTLMRRGGI